MNENQSQALLQQLKEQPEHQLLRLVLTVKVVPSGDESAPTPDRFPSRVEYRQALISRQSAIGADQVESAAERFRGLGLKTLAGALTKSIVVEGTPDRLAEVLQDEAIESAVLDEELTLIRPVRGHELGE